MSLHWLNQINCLLVVPRDKKFKKERTAEEERQTNRASRADRRAALDTRTLARTDTHIPI